MLDCARGLLAAKGLSGGLYRGFWPLVCRCVRASSSLGRSARIADPDAHTHPNICRDAPTYGLYFVVYEVIKDRLIPPGSGGDAVSDEADRSSTSLPAPQRPTA